MRKYWSHLVVLVVAMTAMGMVGCSKRPNSDTAQPTQPAVTTAAASPESKPVSKGFDRTGWPVIVALGDSLTFGQGVPFERNYPSQLQEALDKQGIKYRVVNAGISGDTTAGGLARINTVLQHKPEIVVLELGANDGLRGLPVVKMRENLAAIIERLQTEKIKVVLAGMQIPPNYGPEYTTAFKQTFDDLAATYKLAMIPFFLDGVAALPQLNQADGIHPTADGYEYVVRNVLSILQPMVGR